MSRFTGPLRLEHLDAQWRNWRLLEDLVWEADYQGSQRIITVPKDFITDGATVPRLFWWIFPMTGKYLRAACLHDMLCRLVRGGTPHVYAPTRRAADYQFRLAMQASGVAFIDRWVLWAAVRVFAFIAGRK